MEHIKHEKLTVSICAASDDFYRQLLRRDFKVLSQLREFQSTFKNPPKEKAYQMEQTVKFFLGMLNALFFCFPDLGPDRPVAIGP